MTRKVSESDVTIVGRGPAGLLCVKRLRKGRPDLRLASFDAAPTTGGRLASLKSTFRDAPIECGATFVSSNDEYVLGLADALSCERREIKFARAGAFLRGAWTANGDSLFKFASPAADRYATQLIASALGAMSGELAPLQAPPATASARADLMRKLRSLEIDGRLLADWPADALLDRAMAHEEQSFARLTHGSMAAFASFNAFDAICAQVRETAPAQRFFVFTHGFQSFAAALSAAAPDVCAEHGHRLVAVEHDGVSFILRFLTEKGVLVWRTRALILALPQQALKRLKFGEGVVTAQFHADLDAVAPIAAFKLFLEFDEDWWSGRTRADAGARFSAVYTDLPIQQCYFEPGGAAGGVVMAAFTDEHHVLRWQALREDASQNPLGLASPLMIETAMRQLRRMYGTLPEPRGGIFADWADGAWHAWRAGVRSWDVRTRMRQPNPELPLFICGEAFADHQGWTEGALNNAEAMLQRGFGLDRPDWVGFDYPLET